MILFLNVFFATALSVHEHVLKATRTKACGMARQHYEDPVGALRDGVQPAERTLLGETALLPYVNGHIADAAALQEVSQHQYGPLEHAVNGRVHYQHCCGNQLGRHLREIHRGLPATYIEMGSGRNQVTRDRQKLGSVVQVHTSLELL